MDAAPKTDSVDVEDASAPRLVRRGWNPPPAGIWAWLTARNVRRALTLAVAVALMAWLGWLVWGPLDHPHVHFVCVSGADYRVLRAPALAFAAEDVQGLAEHGRLFGEESNQSAPYVWDSLAEPAKFQSLGGRLNGIVDGGRDQVVLFVTAHAMLEGSDAYLLCRNFDPVNPRAGRVAVSDLVKYLHRCRAGRKVLILDAGRLAGDARLGFIWNDFAERVAREVRATGDESLWLLAAHSSGDQSHTATAIERSVFSYALQWGLAGAADENADQTVSLGELSRYVTAHVSDWAHYVSGGASDQQPLLAWGGESEPETHDSEALEAARQAREVAAAKLILAPVAPDFSLESMPSLAEQVQSARVRSRGEAWYVAFHAENKSRQANGTPADVKSNAAMTAATSAVTDSVKQLDFRHVRSVGQLRAQADASARSSARQAANQAVEAQTAQIAANDQPATPNAAPAPAEATGAASPPAEIASTSDAPAPGAPATPSSPAESGTGGATPSSPNPVAARTAAPQLFAEAWKLRDDLAALPPESRPQDYAPHVWREVQQALLDYEIQYRAGRVGDVRRIGEGVRRLIAGQKRLLAAASDPNIGAAETGVMKILKYRPWAARQVDGAHSAAMARLVDDRAGRQREAAAASIIAASAALPPDQVAFRSFWATLPPDARQYVEVRAAETFSAAPSDAWPTARLAWECVNISETLAAAAPWQTPWIGTELAAADAQRWEGERELLDAIGADHAARARNLLEQSLARYRTVAERLEIVAQARQLERQLLANTPHYQRLASAPQVNPTETAAARTAFIAHCELLGQLSDLMATPDAARIHELRDLTARLGELRLTLEAPLSADRLAALTSPPAQPGEPGQIAAILATPLLPAEARLKLLSIGARLEGRLIADLKPLRNAEHYRPPLADPAEVARRVAQAAELHRASARLCQLDRVDGRQDDARVDTAYIALQEAAQRVSIDAPAAIEEFHARLERFQAALGSFHTALPRRIADAAKANEQLGPESTRAERLVALRRVDRALRLVDPRDVRQTGDVAVGALIDAADWHALLSWHAERAALAAAQATGADADHWRDIAANYRQEANEIFGSDASGDVDAGAPLVLSGDELLDLTVEPSQPLALTLRNRTAAPVDVWLTLKYDPAIVAIEPNGQVNWRPEHEVAEATADDATRVAAVLAGEPSLRVNPGQEIPLRLSARSLGRASQPARVIVQALTRDASVRHALTLRLPSTESIDLAIDGAPGAATRDADGWLLMPFPNRDNTYRWTLLHGAAASKEIKAELFALTRPWPGVTPAGSLSAAEAAEVRDRLGPLEPRGAVEKIVLAGGRVPTPIPFPAPAADAAPPADQPPPPLPRFDHGLLLVLTDLSDGRVSLHRIRSSPQRPRRYVRPRVRYNALEERIEITVTAENPAGMPETPVRVACATWEPLPTGTQARLSDELRGPEYRAELWIEAPLDPARVVTFSLSVDDYPRAFVFRVPCQEAGRDLPPAEDLLAIRVTSPAPDTAFKAPAASIDVRAEVDLPRAAEDDPSTEIELGFDTDRDREFRGEATARLTGDRQVAQQLARLAPGGVVVVHPKVTDYQLPLTPPGLVNNRVGVMGRVLWGDRAAWSEPREILLDGAAPRIERVRVKPAGVAAIGAPVEVSCLALDGDLSGVASVEMTIDQQGTAEFTGNLPPTPAKLGADRRWTAQLDTAPIGSGSYHVLIRATDQVGNVSEVDSSGTVRLLTAEAIAAERRRATNRVAGAVQYGRSGFGGITVTLEALPPDPMEAATTPPPLPPEPIPAVATDDAGSFLFERVPPGRYKLTAEGVVRNKVRRAEAEVTVEPAPTAVRPLRLELR